MVPLDGPVNRLAVPRIMAAKKGTSGARRRHSSVLHATTTMATVAMLSAM